MSSTHQPPEDLSARIVCPTCNAVMTLSLVVPDGPDHELQTFRCGVCGTEESKLVKYE
jgi:hypothetical protein